MGCYMFIRDCAPPARAPSGGAPNAAPAPPRRARAASAVSAAERGGALLTLDDLKASRWCNDSDDSTVRNSSSTLSSYTRLRKTKRALLAEQKELQRKEKAMAEMAALLVLRKKWEAFCSEDAEG